MSKTYLTRGGVWVSTKPDSYWSGLVDIDTKEKIYTGDVFIIENARGHYLPVTLTCTDYIASQSGTWNYRERFIIKKLKD